MNADAEDDDVGFQMMSKEDMITDTQCARPLTLKVTNLIDMTECNAMAEEPLELSACTTLPTVVQEHDFEMDETGNLLQEIAMLRQQLSDARAEAAIQVEIVRDELAERSLQVQELQRLRAEDEVSLRQARARVQELESVDASALVPADSEALAALVAEVRQLCQARHDLRLTATEVAGDVGAQLRCLRDSMAALPQACSDVAPPSPDKPPLVNDDAGVKHGSSERRDGMSKLALEAIDVAREMSAKTQSHLDWFTALFSTAQPR